MRTTRIDVSQDGFLSVRIKGTDLRGGDRVLTKNGLGTVKACKKRNGNNRVFSVMLDTGSIRHYSASQLIKQD